MRAFIADPVGNTLSTLRAPAPGTSRGTISTGTKDPVPTGRGARRADRSPTSQTRVYNIVCLVVVVVSAQKTNAAGGFEIQRYTPRPRPRKIRF